MTRSMPGASQTMQVGLVGGPQTGQAQAMEQVGRAGDLNLLLCEDADAKRRSVLSGSATRWQRPSPWPLRLPLRLQRSLEGQLKPLDREVIGLGWNQDGVGGGLGILGEEGATR